ncbi:RagB/SusD family nutrient uptake outer membrane protein [Pedobacter caeni]|nr:RagB/SusD family nutrient uptake outer membrane protein [Pedobacter caeni]
MAGILTQMINGTGTLGTRTFSNGLTTLLGGLSADEFDSQISGPTVTYYQFNSNNLNINVSFMGELWESAYQAVYGANAILEGIEASKSPTLHQKVRTELAAEAKFIRAFSYFYLLNLFGDVPLAMTTDFNKTKNLPRAAVSVVYQQIINDLNDAVNGLPADYSAGGGERIRANKWAAKALLARVYLFTGAYTQALTEANEVIAQTGLYRLEELDKIFLKNSSESIWQLQQNTNAGPGTSTPEGDVHLPNPLHSGTLSFTLSRALLKTFEAGDLRGSLWVDSADYTNMGITTRTIFPFKYKSGKHNRVLGGVSTEYYMVLRLAEQYLIRAEANALNGQTGAALADLNILRNRAGLGELPVSLTKEEVLAAVAKERQTELFTEWGHRWFDLKRTGKAQEVLSALPVKQPWRGNYQLLYPIPKSEILRGAFLVQNPNY